MRLLLVFGTRPEAIKMAPVYLELRKRPGVTLRVCVTAQHRHMLDQVLDLFGIPVDQDLNLMGDNQTLFQITAGVLRGLEAVLEEEQPDVMLVQGDTTTCFGAALAAYYLRIPIAHVEAGLRSGDKHNPFPEEINRRLTDAISDWCFAPTDHATQCLQAEGIPAERIFLTGNTVIDALQIISHRQTDADEQRKCARLFTEQHGIAVDDGTRLLLVTSHRRESFGPDIEGICHGVRMIAEKNENVRIVYPVHLNPNVQGPANRILTGLDRVHLIEPLDYGSLVWLLGRCYFVLTDSGGIQEEAPTLGKPVLIMRKTTERPEGIECGVAKLVGTDSASIYSAAQELLDNSGEYNRMVRSVNPYGDGRAAERIVDILTRTLCREVEARPI